MDENNNTYDHDWRYTWGDDTLSAYRCMKCGAFTDTENGEKTLVNKGCKVKENPPPPLFGSNNPPTKSPFGPPYFQQSSQQPKPYIQQLSSSSPPKPLGLSAPFFEKKYWRDRDERERSIKACLEHKGHNVTVEWMKLPLESIEEYEAYMRVYHGVDEKVKEVKEEVKMW